MESEFNLTTEQSIIVQLKNQNQELKSKKGFLSEKKKELSNAFVERFDTKEKIQKEAPQLYELTNRLLEKLS